jgi:hypothetical protein
LVGSRRHTPGPGDLLAVKVGERPRLIEVKAGRLPYENFRPDDRRAILEAAWQAGADAELCWTPSKSMCQFLPSRRWPGVEDVLQEVA